MPNRIVGAQVSDTTEVDSSTKRVTIYELGQDRKIQDNIGALTSYTSGNNKYCSYILGNDLNRIKQAAAIRGLNEQIESGLTNVEIIPDYSQLNDLELKKRLPEILHTACFISVVALKAKTITIEEVLGDEGVIHELTHVLANIEGCNKKSLNCIRDLLKHLQMKAIGFYEPV